MWNSHLKASGIDTVVKAYYVIWERKTPKHMKISDLHISPKLLFCWLTVLAYPFSLDICTETLRVVFTAHDHKRAALNRMEWDAFIQSLMKTALEFMQRYYERSTGIQCIEILCKLVHLWNNLYRSTLFPSNDHKAWFYEPFRDLDHCTFWSKTGYSA